MTAFAAPHPTTYRPYLPALGEGTGEIVRSSLRRWRSAFTVAGTTRRGNLDSAALLISGRD